MLASSVVRELTVAVERVRAVVAVDLPAEQALADAAELLSTCAALQAVTLSRLADVDTRGLHRLAGAPTTCTWVRRQDSAVTPAQLSLARRLTSLPLLSEQVLSGGVSLQTAGRLQTALTRCRRHLDRPDGRIDGQDGEQALAGVIGNGVREAVAQARGEFAGPDDPALLALVDQLAGIQAGRSGATQIARLEAALLVLAEHVEPGQLQGHVDELVDALLPDQHEQRARGAQERRALTLHRVDDGSGWLLRGELDLQCGERLHALLHAELVRDPDQPLDTVAAAQLRDQGIDPYDPDATDGLPACTVPRSRTERWHDALSRGLARYLDAGLGGESDKVAAHIVVTVNAEALDGVPGARPARGASGARLPISLVRRWACEGSRLTRQVLDLAGRVIETSHTERTLKAHERRAKHTETGGQCQGAGCRRSTADPGVRLHAHHPTPWADCHSTSLEDSVLLCDVTHQDVHEGKIVLLKNGRYLGPHGYVDGP